MRVCICVFFYFNPLILNFSSDAHDEVHAGLHVNQENFSSFKKNSMKQKQKVFLLVVMSLLLHGYCHSPETISRTRHWGARGTQLLWYGPRSRQCRATSSQVPTRFREAQTLAITGSVLFFQLQSFLSPPPLTPPQKV